MGSKFSWSSGEKSLDARVCQIHGTLSTNTGSHYLKRAVGLGDCCKPTTEEREIALLSRRGVSFIILNIVGCNVIALFLTGRSIIGRHISINTVSPTESKPGSYLLLRLNTATALHKWQSLPAQRWPSSGLNRWKLGRNWASGLTFACTSFVIVCEQYIHQDLISRLQKHTVDASSTSPPAFRYGWVISFVSGWYK